MQLLNTSNIHFFRPPELKAQVSFSGGLFPVCKLFTVSFSQEPIAHFLPNLAQSILIGWREFNRTFLSVSLSVFILWFSHFDVNLFRYRHFRFIIVSVNKENQYKMDSTYMQVVNLRFIQKRGVPAWSKNLNDLLAITGAFGQDFCYTPLLYFVGGWVTKVLSTSTCDTYRLHQANHIIDVEVFWVPDTTYRLINILYVYLIVFFPAM